MRVVSVRVASGIWINLESTPGFEANQYKRWFSIKFDLMGFRMLLRLCSLPGSSLGVAASDAAGVRNTRMYSQLCTAIEFYVKDVPTVLARREGSGRGSWLDTLVTIAMSQPPVRSRTER